MLLPGGVRKGMVSCSGPLFICTGPPPYIVLSGRKVSSLNQLLLPRHHHVHNSHHGHKLANDFRHQSCDIPFKFRDTRANSSLARAKAARRKGRTPQQPADQPQTSGTSNQSALTPRVTELKTEIARHDKLKDNYYKAIDNHSDVFWLTWEERKEVPPSYHNRWVTRPQQSRNSQCYGISRQKVFAPQIAGYISDPDVRKRIISWEQDSCRDFAPAFKEMVLSRATIAHLTGLDSYFDYMSKFKMLDSRSVKRFLQRLDPQVEPLRNAFLESAIEQKMKSFNYDFTIKGLRQRLKIGTTIRDYQSYQPDAQINWGDLACTYILKYQISFSPKCPIIWVSFP